MTRAVPRATATKCVVDVPQPAPGTQAVGAPDELVARVGALSRRVQTRRFDGNGLPSGLTPRETEILSLLADGRSQRDMAKLLSISPKTVALHIEHILGKLEVHSRAEAVAAAYQRKLLGRSA